MKDLRARLQEGDPVAREGGLSLEHRDRMRRHVLTATPTPVPPPSRVFLALATALVLVTAGATLVTHRLASRASADDVVAVPESSGPSTVRQLQFSAPGGTRLIWIFNPNLPVR